MGLTIRDVDDGAVFRTVSGVWAVMTEYHYPNSTRGPGPRRCVLLDSGEDAHFPLGDAEPVALVVDVPALFPAPT